MAFSGWRKQADFKKHLRLFSDRKWPNMLLNKLSRMTDRYVHIFRFGKRERAFALISVVVLVGSLGMDIFRAQDLSMKYNIDSLVGTILEEPIELYSSKLEFDAESNSFNYNEGYNLSTTTAGQNHAPKFSANFYTNEDESAVEVIDPINNASFKIIPEFDLAQPQKKDNRIIYPLLNHDGSKIFTLNGTSIKEDVVLFDYNKDKIEFDYRLEFPNGMEARPESDGSIGVYSISTELLSNQIAVGSDQDQELLEKLRDNQEKTKFLFKIPAPFILESNGKTSKTARAWFSMPDTTTLRVHAVGLEDLSYPISIDPSVYIETARKLMRGNNETNVDFDTTNELVNKGFTTGARFDDWDNTTQLNESRWNGASDVAGGFIYYSGGETAGSFTDTEFTTAGSDTYDVPSGVTEVTVKTWGAGGGGGGASTDRDGGNGGGGGYAATTLTVTALETLNVYIGGGGGGGTGGSTGTNSGNGGGGGGFSGVFRSTTPLIMAAGGGGGGGGNGDSGSTARQPGDDAGAGGGTTGTAGDGNDTTTGGGGGTPSAGGSGGTTGGSAGTIHTGAGGGEGGGTGTAQANGGSNDGGDGGSQENGGGPNKKPGGGGGGGGYYGGGGGGQRDSQYNGGGGGGGGSSYTTGSPATNASGSGQDPGNKADADRGGVGDGADGGTTGGNGSDGDDGKVIISYATGSGDSVHEDVYWAQLNTSTGAIDSPNPGDGACVNWCTNVDYELPDEREGHAMVSYNGFLYVIGGKNESGTRQSTVWIAKLGANGEPALWHPTDDDKSNWDYWHVDTAFSEAIANHSMYAYRNKLYVLGGTTTGATSGIATVRMANIEPTGTLDSWTTTGATDLDSIRYGHTTHVYNDYMYVIGGRGASGTLQNSVEYLKLDDDGDMNSWNATESFTDARMTWGGKNTAVYGGYLYLSGGCSAVDGSGYCTTVENDTQLASINADGTITEWNTIADLTKLSVGHSISAWRGYIYGIGGCTAQSASNGLCTDIIDTNDYGTINTDGDASTVSDSVNQGSGTCTGGDPYDCDSPPLGNSNGEGGQMAGGVVINNGHIYYIGGCREVGGSGQICTNGSASRTTDTIYYAEIANDGTLRQSPGCDTGDANIEYAEAWCVDNNNTINGSVGLAAFGYTVFNNTIYAIGGTDGADWQNDVYYNALNADGTLNSWSSQTQASAGLTSTSIGYPFVFARANPASAGTNPGNMYIVGGCSNGTNAGLDCTSGSFLTSVYKCNIGTSGALASCSTTNQTQLDSEPGTGGSQGLGIMAGTVYANYIYLIGGQSDNEGERGTVMYAYLDDSGDIVDPDGESVTDDIWETSANEISPSRRRGIAFGYNGYIYALAGFAVDTGLNDLLFAKVDVSDGSIGAFTVSGVTVNQRWDLRGVVSSGYVYTLGGCGSGAPPATCNAMTATVQTFQLYDNFSGSTSDYTSGSNDFATDRIGGSAAVLNGYLYMAGGCTATTSGDCTAATANVERAPLNDDGSIGTWVAETGSGDLPAARAWGQLEVAGGDLYYLGGQSSGESNAVSTVYYATPSSGDITSWSTASGGIGDTGTQAAQNRTEFSAAVWNDRIYVVGGYDGSAVSDDVYISPQLSSGGNIAADGWTEDTDDPDVARRGHTVVAYANNLYVFGGYDGTNYLNDAQYAQINNDGTVDAWEFSTSLPETSRNSDGFARNGYIYLFGGRSADTTCHDNTIITPISANTSITSGNNPTGTGEWYQTREELDGTDRAGAAAAYNEGKAYVLGGGCGASVTLTGSDNTLYATLFSQPQVTRYTRMIDTDTDVFPTKWLMNGVDNDIGARWQLTYQSSTDTNNAWGENTNFGEVTLGNPETYNPLNDTYSTGTITQSGTTVTGSGTTFTEEMEGATITYDDDTTSTITTYNSATSLTVADTKTIGSGESYVISNIDTEFARYYYFSVDIDASQTYGYPDDVTRGPTIDDLSIFFTADPNKRLRHGKTFTGGEKQPLDTPF